MSIKWIFYDDLFRINFGSLLRTLMWSKDIIHLKFLYNF